MKSDFDPKEIQHGSDRRYPCRVGSHQSWGQSPACFLSRHVAQDWGDLDEEDKQLNDQAVQDGSRILSAYHTSDDTKLWIITEAEDGSGQRAATTILLPQEY